MSSRSGTGLMSLMQFWTKFYADLGRPLPKVDAGFMFSFSFFFKCTRILLFEGFCLFAVILFLSVFLLLFCLFFGGGIACITNTTAQVTITFNS